MSENVHICVQAHKEWRVVTHYLKELAARRRYTQSSRKYMACIDTGNDEKTRRFAKRVEINLGMVR